MVENLQKVFQFCVELFQQMHIAHVIVSAPLRLIFSDRALLSLACFRSTHFACCSSYIIYFSFSVYSKIKKQPT